MNRLRAILLVFLFCTLPAAADTVVSIHLPAKDLVYDPFRGMIYASVPGRAGALGNSVIALDPVTYTLAPPLYVGSEPGKLALSDDGWYLYVALDGAAAVRRVNLTAQRAELQFPLGRTQYGDLLFAEDIEVLPGHPESVAISRNNHTFGSFFGGVAIYDDGVPRPQVAQAGDSHVIQFSASASRLYGHDNLSTAFSINRLQVDAGGVSLIDGAWNLTDGFNQDMKFDNGLLYTSSGTVIDPEAKKAVGAFPGVYPPALVRPDSRSGRVFFLTGAGTTRELSAYETGTLRRVGGLAVPGVSGKAGSLIRWGQQTTGGRPDTGGLAFRTDDDQLFLIRTSLVPSPPLSVFLGAGSVVGGTAVPGTVSLLQAAPAGGTIVQLAVSSPALHLPASVRVPAGALEAGFTAMTDPVPADSFAEVTARTDGVTASTRLWVRAPTLASLAVSASTLHPGGTVTGTVTLTGPAPAGGIPIRLTSDLPALLTPPATVTVLAGQSAVTFPLTAPQSTLSRSVEITANGPGGSAKITVRVAVPELLSLTFDTSRFVPGTRVTGTVTLAEPAPPGGASVDLFLGDLGFTQPEHVIVPEGSVRASFPIQIPPDLYDLSAMLTASYGGLNRSVTVQVEGPHLTALTLRPVAARGGTTVAGAVTLDIPAPPNGWEIPLKSDQPDVARVPPSVRVPAGATTGAFTIDTGPVAVPRPVLITGSRSFVSFSAALALLPPAVAGLAVGPASVTGGATAAGTVTLDGPAAEGGALVALASSDPSAARVPDNVRVPAGGTTVQFPVTTLPVRAAASPLLTAAAGGARATAALQVVPPSPGARGQGAPTFALSLSAAVQLARVISGRPAVGTVRLSRPAPAGGLPVTLTSERPEIAGVPPVVMVPPGATAAIFAVTTSRISTAVSVRIRAAYGTATASARIAVARG